MGSRKATKGGPEILTGQDAVGIFSELRKEHGEDRIFWGSDERLHIVKLPLGIDTLDRALGGGFAFGRFALLYGEWSSGKSLISLFAIKAAQDQGYATAYIDVERTFDPDWAAVLGVDLSKLLVSQPRSGEEAFDVLDDLCRARFGMVIMDSIAACVPVKLLEGEKDPLGARARLLNSRLAKTNTVNGVTAIVLINQMREGIGIMFGDPRVLPGGKGQHFFPSLKVKVTRGDWIEEKIGEPTKPGDKPRKKRVGYHLKVVIEKNKQGGSHMFDEGEVPFLFSGVVDVVAGLVPLALDLGIIRQSGANYEVLGEKIFGRRNLVEHLTQHPEVQEQLRRAIQEVPEF